VYTDTYEEADKVCYDFQQTSSIEGNITNEEIEDLLSHNSATGHAERRRKCGRRWSHGKYSVDNEGTRFVSFFLRSIDMILRLNF
jgi:hypothetical protein